MTQYRKYRKIRGGDYYTRLEVHQLAPTIQDCLREEPWPESGYEIIIGIRAWRPMFTPTERTP